MEHGYICVCVRYKHSFEVLSIWITSGAQMNLVLRIVNVNIFTYINRCLTEFKCNGAEGKRIRDRCKDEIDAPLRLTSHLRLT